MEPRIKEPRISIYDNFPVKRKNAAEGEYLKRRRLDGVTSRPSDDDYDYCEFMQAYSLLRIRRSNAELVHFLTDLHFLRLNSLGKTKSYVVTYTEDERHMVKEFFVNQECFQDEASKPIHKDLDPYFNGYFSEAPYKYALPGIDYEIRLPLMEQNRDKQVPTSTILSNGSLLMQKADQLVEMEQNLEPNERRHTLETNQLNKTGHELETERLKEVGDTLEDDQPDEQTSARLVTPAPSSEDLEQVNTEKCSNVKETQEAIQMQVLPPKFVCQSDVASITKQNLQEALATADSVGDETFNNLKYKMVNSDPSDRRKLFGKRDDPDFDSKKTKFDSPEDDEKEAVYRDLIRNLPQPQIDTSLLNGIVFHTFDPLLTVIDQIANGTPPSPHVSMRYELLRFCTLRSYPKENKPYLIKLAEAGFYYASDGDDVVCYCSGVRRYNWVAEDDPMKIHQRINPNCKFLRKNEEVNVPVQYFGPFSIPEPRERTEQSEDVNNDWAAERIRSPAPTQQNRQIETGENSLGINTAIPKHTQYATKTAREASYSGWPDTASHNPQELADAGFFYAGLLHWTKDDNPWIEHARWSRNCVFVKQMKGEEFVNLVQLAVQYSQDNEAQSNSSAGNQLPAQEIERILLSDASQTVLEMGYQLRIIKKAIEQILRQDGNAKITAQILMEKVLEIEEAENPPQATPAPAPKPAAAAAAPAQAKSVSQTAKREGAKAVEGAAKSNTEKKPDEGTKASVQNKDKGINTAIPKHAQYATKMAREGSYSGWPDTASHNPQVLAEAGLFYAGFGDCVRCFHCGIGLRHWTKDDNPWIEHARWSRNCVFVKQMKGEEFVNLVQPAVQYSQDNEAGSNSTAGNQLPAQEIERIFFSDALQTLLEMGYQLRIIKKAIEQILRQDGNAKITAQILMEKVLEIEEAENPPQATPAPAPKPAAAAAAPAQAKSVSQTAKREGAKAVEGAAKSNTEKKPDEGTKASVQNKDKGINTAIPKHAQYATKMAREGSYSGWPDTASHNPQVLAEAGLFYAGFGDCVRCFHCGIGLRHWTEGDDPWIEHARWSRNCVFVKQMKGEEFVNLVQLAVQYSQDNEAGSNSTAGNQLPAQEIERIFFSDAAQSVLEMGYQPRIIKKAIEQILRQDGNAKITAVILMDKVLEIEEAENSPQATPAPAPKPAAAAAAPAQAKSVSQTAKREGAKAVEGAAKSNTEKKPDEGTKASVQNKDKGNAKITAVILMDKVLEIEEAENSPQATPAPAPKPAAAAAAPAQAKSVSQTAKREGAKAVEGAAKSNTEKKPDEGTKASVQNKDKGSHRWTEDGDCWMEHACWYCNWVFQKQQKGHEFVLFAQLTVQYFQDADAKVQKVHMCHRKQFASNKLHLKTISYFIFYLLTNKGAHTYNGNGRTSGYNTRASKGKKKETSYSCKKRQPENKAKRYRKVEDLKSQIENITPGGQQKVSNGSLNFRKKYATIGPVPARLVRMSADAMCSVGVLEGGKFIGTIFRVGRQFGMTAAHVIDSIINPHKANGCDDFSQLTHCAVRFCEQEQTFKLKPVLHFKDSDLDVAIVEFLDCDVHRLPQPLQLVHYDISSTLKKAYIIGYGNPEKSGQYLEMDVDVIQQQDIPKKEISKYLSKYKKTFRTGLKIMGNCADIVETAYSGCEAQSKMLLNCIMGPGASGSPVFTTEFQESLKVAGLYICGFPKMYYQFPEAFQKIFPTEYTFEAATKTSAIYDALRKHNKKMAKAIFGC